MGNVNRVIRKKMTQHKRMKLQKWVDWMMAKGVKNKGRVKKPATTNNWGRIIK